MTPVDEACVAKVIMFKVDLRGYPLNLIKVSAV